MTMQIGAYKLDNPLILAPMAGVTDRPFRQLCRAQGAALAISEMVSVKPELRGTRKSISRLNHEGEAAPIAVQIAGADPQMMADAARFNVDNGAQIIDINMGCPAKKVCNVMAGSALLQDETLVGDILKAVVDAVDVPVTLKIRTGWDRDHRNGLSIAHIAEASGIQALAIHGRTRSDAYKGQAEYDTIAQIKQQVAIPVIANGDIDSPEKARFVLDYTKADAIMIGRAAQGKPWIFRQINHFLQTGEKLPEPPAKEIRDLLLQHLENLYNFYGEHAGVRIARKHISWYIKGQADGQMLWQRVNKIEDATHQSTLVRDYFDTVINAEMTGSTQQKNNQKVLAA